MSLQILRRTFAAALSIGSLTLFASAAPAAETAGSAAAEPTTDAEEYGRGVRTTDPRSPEDQRAGFHLPAGMTIELVASEPAIAKPLNMAFDWRGRLWVTQTYEYPYPYKPESDPEGRGPRDSVVVLEDKDGDGYRETATTFADKLNIPIGILPYGDGCLCFSIPNIYYLRDTDGDGVCDDRRVVLGPFDTTRDTHGMVNSLRWMPDGWVMANHGFNNQSTVAGTDGKSVTLVSGNVFRFRPDGSSVELFAAGQVNPFGMAIDRFGGVFTADCHSKPISQIIQGGFYPSFGRPHDGLGFIPPVMDHLHGSTAISGLEIGRGSLLGSQFDESFLSGNVMTSRINHNKIVRKGLTVTAAEQPDFMTSDDPWFRPADIRLGPDGWLYVADFYNRIIGHYEVPLDHPDRDRFRGRIWRIGPAAASESFSMPDLTAAEGCMASLDSENPTIVRLSLQRYAEILRLKGAFSAAPIAAMGQFDTPQRVWATWIALTGGTGRAHLPATVADVAELVRRCREADDATMAAAFRIVSAASQDLGVDLSKLDGLDREKIGSAVLHAMVSKMERPHAAQAAGQLLSRGDDAPAAYFLINNIAAIASEDPMLHASLRIETRRGLITHPALVGSLTEGWQPSGDCGAVDGPVVVDDKKDGLPRTQASIGLDTPAADELFDILLAMPLSEDGASAVFAYLDSHRDRIAENQQLVLDVAAALPAEQLPRLMCLLQGSAGHAAALDVLPAIVERLEAEGKISPPVKQLVRETVAAWRSESTTAGDSPRLISWWKILKADSKAAADEAITWPVQRRNHTGGGDIEVFSSFPLGESYVGEMVSGPLPKGLTELKFAICGHNGNPSEPDSKKNRIELVDATTGEVLATAYPPRNDAASEVRWDLSPWQGRQMVVRVVDGDERAAYAWLAVGGFEPAGLNPAIDRNRFHAAVTLLQAVGGLETATSVASPPLGDVDPGYASLWLHAAAQTPRLEDTLVVWAARRQLMPWTRPAATAAQRDGQELSAVHQLLEQVSLRSDAGRQTEVVSLLAGQTRWHDSLLMAVERGWLSRESLMSLPATWWQANQSEAAKKLAELRPEADADRQRERREMLVRRQTAVEAIPGDSAAGRVIFAAQCAACHQFAGQGQVVGPQLEGVGGRGLARLCEDILLPNQNVDHAFAVSTILTVDGTILSGLVRQRDDERIVLVDSRGKSETVPAADVEAVRDSNMSLMPENIADQLTDQQLADLIAYLRRPVQ